MTHTHTHTHGQQISHVAERTDTSVMLLSRRRPTVSHTQTRTSHTRNESHQHCSALFHTGTTLYIYIYIYTSLHWRRYWFGERRTASDVYNKVCSTNDNPEFLMPETFLDPAWTGVAEGKWEVDRWNKKRKESAAAAATELMWPKLKVSSERKRSCCWNGVLAGAGMV